MTPTLKGMVFIIHMEGMGVVFVRDCTALPLPVGRDWTVRGEKEELLKQPI